MKKELTVTEKIAQDVRLINNFTDYELIEIEQTNRFYKRMQGVQICHYKILWDESEPGNPTVREIKPRIIGGELVFADNPFNRKPIEGGTGRVAFLVNDNEDTPEGALSGEVKGWNQEFLAAHYADGWFKIVDKKWDKIIRKRHEEILKKIESCPPQKHVFEKKYNVKGITNVDERIKVEVEQPQSVQDMIKSFQDERLESQKTIKKLLEKVEALEKTSKPDKKEPVVENGKKSNFVEE